MQPNPERTSVVPSAREAALQGTVTTLTELLTIIRGRRGERGAMYVSCLATDYDGTLAHDGVVEQATVNALIAAKRPPSKKIQKADRPTTVYDSGL
jgi:hypothetical protein